MVFAELSEGQHGDAADDGGGAGSERAADFAERLCQRLPQLAQLSPSTALLQLFPVSGDKEQTIIHAGAIGQNRDVDSIGLRKSHEMMLGQQRQEVNGNLHRDKDRSEGDQRQNRRAINDEKQTDDQPDRPGLNAMGAFLFGLPDVPANDRASGQGDVEPVWNLVFPAETFNQVFDRLDRGPGTSVQEFHR